MFHGLAYEECRHAIRPLGIGRLGQFSKNVCRQIALQKNSLFLGKGDEAIKTVQAILKRGNDVEIRRKGDGYIVLEVKKTIKYTSAQ